jgi:integrase
MKKAIHTLKENDSHSAEVKKTQVEAATAQTSNHKPLQPQIFDGKRDLYGFARQFEDVKRRMMKEGIVNLSKANSDLLIRFILDCEKGANVGASNRKGPRTPGRLLSSLYKCTRVFAFLEERGIKDVTKCTEDAIRDLFQDMRDGKIVKKNGEKFKAVPDFAQDFKVFWHWYMRVRKKDGHRIDDITTEINMRVDTKPKWVYLDENQINEIISKMPKKYLVFLEFLYDSGARPLEALSLCVKDITLHDDGFVYADIRQEISKSAGRKIRLPRCGQLILNHIAANKLNTNDRLFFTYSSTYANRMLRVAASELFGNAVSKAGEYYSKLSLYDFRHCSACFWLPKYAKNSELMYRFGWKSEEFVFYYSEFLGMADKADLVDKKKVETEMMQTLSKQDQKINDLQNMLLREHERQAQSLDQQNFMRLIEKQSSEIDELKLMLKLLIKKTVE